MSLGVRSFGINRRLLLASLAAALAILPASLLPGSILAQSTTAADPLSSWNDGQAKQAIVDFVKRTTDQSSANFVPTEARIATFDQDGTLWVEHPIYSQVVYCLDRVPAVVKERPELANVEPFKTVLSGDREAIAKLSTDDLFKILAVTLSGMTVDQFQAEAKDWLKAAKDPRWKRPYTELTYEQYWAICVLMGSKPILPLVAAKTSCGCTHRTSMAFRRNRWSAPRAIPSIATTRMANRF